MIESRRWLPRPLAPKPRTAAADASTIPRADEHRHARRHGFWSAAQSGLEPPTVSTLFFTTAAAVVATIPLFRGESRVSVLGGRWWRPPGVDGSGFQRLLPAGRPGRWQRRYVGCAMDVHQFAPGRGGGRRAVPERQSVGAGSHRPRRLDRDRPIVLSPDGIDPTINLPLAPTPRPRRSIPRWAHRLLRVTGGYAGGWSRSRWRYPQRLPGRSGASAGARTGR